MCVKHVGCFFLINSSFDSNSSLKLNNTLHVPSVKKNLMSVSKLTKENNIFCEFHPVVCYVSYLKVPTKSFCKDQLILKVCTNLIISSFNICKILGNGSMILSRSNKTLQNINCSSLKIIVIPLFCDFTNLAILTLK